MEYKHIEAFDKSTFPDKLKNYDRVVPASLQVDDHIRYTSNKYKEVGRKCCYGIVKAVNEDGTFMINGYSPNGINEYPDWKLDITNKFKCVLLYKKVVKFNDCIKCGGEVIEPYKMCLMCKNCAVDGE